MDWKKIGLKVGFEIHQQLDTKEKLFCNCPAKLIKNKDPDLIIKRTFRAVAGELEKIDIAARYEQERRREVVYYVWEDVDCLVDIDEEPPHEINKEALVEALKVAIAINCKIPDEIHIMRKTIIDGSCPSGFQRTALVGFSGFIEVDGKKIRIKSICLEEDSGRKIKEEEGKVYFALDRLGIPLIEITTEPDVETPEEARKVAEYIGLFLRSFKVRKELGSIRQDINVSIEGGARVEIKGVQKLDLIPKVVELEAIRQLNLLKIREELKKRGVEKEEIEKEEIVDLTEVFKETKCKFLRKIIEKGGRILGIRLKKFKGILGFEIQPNRRFGTELADIAKFFGLGGILHSDELPNYGISDKEVKKVREILECDENDGFVLVAGKNDEKLKIVIEAIKQRCVKALYGVPEEVRRANSDGTTSFLRPMPGAARMYPETDLLPIKVEKYLEIAKREMPELFFEKMERMKKEYGLKEEVIRKMMRWGMEVVFEESVKKYGINPNVLANLYLSLRTNIRKDLNEEVEINIEALRKASELLGRGKITKDVFHKVYYYLLKGEKEEEILEKFGKIEVEKIKNEIIELWKKYKNEKKVIGELYKKYKGRIDGRELVRYIQRNLQS